MLKLDEIDAKHASKFTNKVKEMNKNTKKDNETKIKENTGGFPGIQVVPETLPAFTEMDYSDTENEYVDAKLSDNVGSKPNPKDTPNKSMDVVSDTDESDNEISQCTVKERNKRITELSIRSVLRSSDSQRNKSNLGEDETEVSNQRKKVKGKSVDSDVENDKLLDTSTRNILDSPESQSFTLKCDNDVNEFINHKTLNLSGESEVFELDSDTEQKDEFHEKLDKKNSKEFENENTGNNFDKALNVKSRKDEILEESEGSLRRSPRKLKVQYYGTPKKSKKKMKESSQLTESEIHDMFSSPSGTDEGDMTVQPTTPRVSNGKGGHVQSIDKLDSQSMDCFNIVPVKDGVPVSVKKFQLKVPRNKRRVEKNQNIDPDSEIHLEVADTHGNDKLSTDSMQSADLKSPSIIANKPVVTEKALEIVLSSPSVGSLTDPESPLLLHDKKDKCKTSGRKNDNQKSSWLKSGNKSTDDDITSKDTINQSVGKKKTNSPSCTRKSSRIKPTKSLCQTTLTQSFLRSPPRKSQRSKGKVKNDETETDHDLQEAIRLSLEEAQSSQPEDEQLNDADLEVLDFGTEKENSPPFKRPSTIPRASLRRRNKPIHSDSSKITVPNPEKTLTGNVLKEVSDGTNLPVNQRFSSEDDGLNGSVDPAVEITALCAESASLETLASLDKGKIKVEQSCFNLNFD